MSIAENNRDEESNNNSDETSKVQDIQRSITIHIRVPCARVRVSARVRIREAG